MSPSSSRAGGQRLRRLLALTVVAATAAAGSAVLAPAASAAEQPWGFEQVTPVNKGTGAVAAFRGFRTSPDGNMFLHAARLPFIDTPTDSSPLLLRYGSTRGDDGWRTIGLDPPMKPRGGVNYGVLQSSEDASHVLVGSNRALTPGATEGGGNLYVRSTRTGAYTLVATSPDYGLAFNGGIGSTQGPTGFAFVANDGRSALFQAPVALRPGDPGSVLYRWTAAGGLEAMSILPEDEGGAPLAGETLGAALAAARDAMPVDDGHALDRVYFSAWDVWVRGVYVREGGETRLVSRSRIPGADANPVPATVDAASVGGRYLTFHTVQGVGGAPPVPLTADTQVSNWWAPYIYRYDAISEEVRYVGTGTYVSQMSPDGKVIVFYGNDALTPDAEDGALNLYVWRDDGSARGSLRLITTADTYGSANGAGLRRLSPNGRYFAFTDDTTANAARFGLENVTSKCPAMYTVSTPGPCEQVYLYDTVSEELSCVSCRTDGRTPLGHSGDPTNYRLNGWIEVDHYQARTVTDDGTVFFSTLDALLPAQDLNSKSDVYAYRDGVLRLLSGGAPDRAARFLDATPDGKTVFLASNQQLAATDVDLDVDVYMTRAGAGFPHAAPTEPAACAGSDCRGQAAAPPPATVAGTRTFSGSDVPDMPSRPRPRAPGVSVAKVKVVRGSVARLAVRVPSRGRLRAAAGGVVSVSRSVAKAGSYRIPVRLKAPGRRALRLGRSVRARVRVTFTPSGGQASSATVSLTFVPARANEKGQQR